MLIPVPLRSVGIAVIENLTTLATQRIYLLVVNLKPRNRTRLSCRWIQPTSQWPVLLLPQGLACWSQFQAPCGHTSPYTLQGSTSACGMSSCLWPQFPLILMRSQGHDQKSLWGRGMQGCAAVLYLRWEWMPLDSWGWQQGREAFPNNTWRASF